MNNKGPISAAICKLQYAHHTILGYSLNNTLGMKIYP